MTDSGSIIDLGELSKPATALIEKISDGIGAVFEPWQIKRVARAKAEAQRIETLANIETSELERRSIQRFIVEESMKQSNMESIIKKALADLQDDAHPELIENDWIANFFDKCRLISDDEMQTLWGKILAGEANTPGKYSKRTVNFVSSLDKYEANLFTQLCSFGWFVPDFVPLICDEDDDIYLERGINFNNLKHLDDIGLITYAPTDGFGGKGLPETCLFRYYDTPINIRFKQDEDDEILMSKVLLSKIGEELAPICGSKPIPEIFDYILKRWAMMGHVTFSDWPQDVG